MVKALKDAPDVSTRLAIATRIADRRWDVRLVNGATVRLPEDDTMESALARLTKLQTRTALMQRPVTMIDLRNKGRIYLSPAQSAGSRKLAEAARS